MYNIGAFAPTAADFRDLVCADFPGADVSFDVNPLRQRIVDSWPIDVDDSAARADWGFKPCYDLNRMWHEYLVPEVRRRYARPA